MRLRCRAIAVLLGALLSFTEHHFVGGDPIVNCVPAGDESNLCEDRNSICADLGIDVVYKKSCGHDEMLFTDPSYPCDCNTVCVKEIAEGESCDISYPASYPTEMCGNGLDCMKVPNEYKFACSRNSQKPCVNLTILYESEVAGGTLGPGMLLPQCDLVGQFGPVQCSTSSTCYCTDVAGNRLFGEGSYTQRDQMDCECSRYWQRNEELGIETGLRCLHTGSIDPLQCNEDFCFCFNSTTASIQQGPFPPMMITQLDCYRENYHQVNYTNPCTEALERYLQENPEDDGTLAIGTSLKPNCGLDGQYDSIQPTSKGYMCSDEKGNMIEDFQFLTSELDTSNCHCATRRSIMMRENLFDFMPDCCPNGNFVPQQVHGMFAYCVDDNGNQVGSAVALTDINSLACSNSCS